MRRILSLTIAALMVLMLTGARAEQAGWQNILLLGGDARDMERYDRSDAMIILSVNREEGRVKMTSIMRDTWVRYPGRGDAGKINAAAVYGGPELAVATVNSCFGTDIEDYVIVNMEDLVTIIDRLGGVDLEITEAERVQINRNARNYTGTAYSGEKSVDTSGTVHLNGLLAMSYCRIRAIDSDFERVMRQQKVLLAMAGRAQEMELSELMKAGDDIIRAVHTSLDGDQPRQLMMALMTVDVGEVGQFRIPADGTYSAGMQGDVWRIEPDFEKNRMLLHEFIYETQ